MIARKGTQKRGEWSWGCLRDFELKDRVAQKRPNVLFGRDMIAGFAQRLIAHGGVALLDQGRVAD